MPTKPVKKPLCNAKYCHFCGYGSDWDVFRASNMTRHMETHHSTAEECVGSHFDPYAKRANTWRVLDETHPDLIVCIRGENGNTVSAVYCLDCNHMEQMADEKNGHPLLRFPSHECPTSRGESKLKGTKRVKAAEPATGGAGVSTPAPATSRALVVPLDWIAKRTDQDKEGYGMAELEKEFEAAKQAWAFEKAAKAALAREAEAMKQLAALKAAAPVAGGGTVDLSTAAEMIVDALCMDSKVGRVVKAEKQDLLDKKAADLSDNPLEYEPYTAYELLVEIANSTRIWSAECARQKKLVEKTEDVVRQRDAELARLKVENHRLIQNYTYCERDKATAEERVRVLEKALVAAKEQAPTPA